MPHALLFVLRPLLRYSYRRDAWILRGIGEQFGPVLCPPGTLLAEASTRAPVAEYEELRQARPHDKRQQAASPRTWALVLMLLGALIAAALGFTIGHGAAGSQSALVLDQKAAAGSLRISYPRGWQRQSPPPTPGLRLTNELVVAPPSGGQVLILGRTPANGPTMLPKSLLNTLPGVPGVQLVNLGGLMFYRYMDLIPRGQRVSESVYALPTTVDTILGLCVTPRPSPSFTSTCERLLGTLKLPAGMASLGLSPSYAATFSSAMARLNAVSSAASLQLRKAGNPRDQAKAARDLAAANAAAASVLLRRGADPAPAPNAAVVAALRALSSAYAALAQAATKGDAGAYDRAGAAVVHANGALSSALAELRTLGYRVR